MDLKKMLKDKAEQEKRSAEWKARGKARGEMYKAEAKGEQSLKKKLKFP